MRPVRVFSRQVSKTQAFEFVPSGDPDFDATSIAIACAGISRKYYLAARLYYMLDLSVVDELERHLWVTSSGMAVERKWTFVKKGEERIRRLCGLAVAEIAKPTRWNDNHKRGQWMRVSAGTFRRTYAGAYGDIYDRLIAWIEVAGQRIAKNTRGS